MNNYNETSYDIPVFNSLYQILPQKDDLNKDIILYKIPIQTLRDSSMYDLSNSNDLYSTEYFTGCIYNDYSKYITLFVFILCIFLFIFFLFRSK